MSNYPQIVRSLVRRVLFAVVCFALGFFVLFRTGGSMLEGYAGGLMGCACIIAGAIVLAFPLARLLSESSGGLFYPGRRFDRPQPMYSIPQAKRQKGQYEEAIAGFEQIAVDYPDEVQPYIEMMDIAIVNLKDPGRANAIYLRGVSAMKKNEDKETLARMFTAIRTRLNARPSN